MIEDLKGKAPGLPTINAADANAAALFAIVDQFEQADAKPMYFGAHFLGRYLVEYNRGYAP